VKQLLVEGDWLKGQGFRLNLCSLLGIQNPNYFWQARSRPDNFAIQDEFVPDEQGTVYDSKPLRVLDAVAMLFRMMNNLDSGTRMNLKEWLIQEDKMVRVDMGMLDVLSTESATGEKTFAPYTFDRTDIEGQRIWSNKLYKFIGIIDNDWINLHRNPYA
jgi:hypothetical protein